MRIRLANSPVSWGVDHLERLGLPDWRKVFDEIRDAEYRWVELGALGYLPREPGRARAEMAQRQLKVAGSYMLAPVHDHARHADVIQTTRETAAFIADAGGRFFVIVDWGSPVRAATAGRGEDAPRMMGEQWSTYLETLSEIAEIVEQDYGLTTVVHPHAGTWLEFEDEIVALLAQTTLEMCIDTGHFVYGGVDPVDAYERFGSRVPYLNFKDIDPVKLERARREKLTFLQAVDRGVFCPLGNGAVDFSALRAKLAAHGYDGHATVEQDRDPSGHSSPLDDARASLAFLDSVGLAQ